MANSVVHFAPLIRLRSLRDIPNAAAAPNTPAEAGAPATLQPGPTPGWGGYMSCTAHHEDGGTFIRICACAEEVSSANAIPILTKILGFIGWLYSEGFRRLLI